ncbi:MAG: sulfoxide reductase heme-binding subunit YedZ [Alphaproteobacteria bacterium]|nr:sulfoxide reductase heme-binding subunit YedZ [Alphaproteobacteria bacterium]
MSGAARAFTSASAGGERLRRARPACYRAYVRKPYQIWRDRRGRLSPLRITTLAALLVPVAIAVHAYATTGFGARPLNDLIHRTGYWCLIFLAASLAVTPLRAIARYGALIDVRRMLGVGAFAYAAAHLALYVADQRYDLGKVASEIALRLYLTIGFTAWLGMAALAVTSTDAMVRRLGAVRWRRLHQIVYVVSLLALIHFFQQTKADVSVPVFVAGLFVWLAGYRLIAARRHARGPLPTALIAALTFGAALLTFAGEAIGIAIAYRVSPLTVLRSAFDFSFDIRPGWYVLAAGLAVTLIDLLRAAFAAQPRATAADQAGSASSGGRSFVPRQRP